MMVFTLKMMNSAPNNDDFYTKNDTSPAFEALLHPKQKEQSEEDKGGDDDSDVKLMNFVSQTRNCVF